MSAHPRCVDGHICQVPSGRRCVETGCDEAAGTLWGPLWCPEHDRQRLDGITASLESIAAARGPVVSSPTDVSPAPTGGEPR